ncbi:hypothetical protein B7494_g2623 [Chlorociboria aeruginascens]|nr:hypothetical protein B7494_g2623 [Chlorociboria aeruginascens]
MSDDSLDLSAAALDPPPGAVQDLDNPPNGNSTVVAVYTVCMVIATIFVALRLYAKFIFLKAPRIQDSTYQNASTSYLFIPPQKLVAWWFKQAYRIQLLAMTFAASQKGWDGVSLLILLIVSLIRNLWLKNSLLARMFCEANGIEIK